MLLFEIKIFRSSLLVIAIIAALSGGRNLLSKEPVKAEALIYQNETIDVCGSDREFIVLLSVGNVVRSDSLYGFNFSVRCDTSVMKFTDVLYQSTLSQFFDLKQVGFPDGNAYGYAANLLGPIVFGDRPLIALLAKYKLDKPDTGKIDIEYIEFTDEFAKEIVEYVPAEIIGVPKDIPERHLSFGSTTDTIENFSRIDSTADYVITFDLERLDKETDTATVMIELQGQAFEIFEITTVTGKIEIMESKIERDAELKLIINEKLSEEPALNIKIKNVTFDESIGNLKISGSTDEICSCITGVNEINAHLKANNEIIDSAPDRKESFYYCLDKKVLCVDYDYKNLKIYDIYGNQVLFKKENNSDYIDVSRMKNGFYIAIIEINQGIKTITFIKV